MQTFLPYPSFARSAAVLDHRRLGKHRVEALPIVRALTRTDYGWQHHPAVQMWRDHEEDLVAYGALVRKQPEWYRPRLPGVPGEPAYVGPVRAHSPRGGR